MGQSRGDVSLRWGIKAVLLGGDHWGRLHGGLGTAPAQWEPARGRDRQHGPGYPQLCGRLPDDARA